MTLGQIGMVAAVQGLMVLILEIPTGGLADPLGRRPVLLVAGVVNMTSLIFFAIADDYLLAGPAGVIAAFVGTYLIHGAANPQHRTLLHWWVDGPYRATVLSLNSMMGRPGLIIGSLALTALADATGTSAAMVVGASIMAAAAPLYLLARRTPILEPTAIEKTPRTETMTLQLPDSR